ncbi:hypothetical protein QBC35DRAFT_467695 [Podospora australis]|uniref:Uncharacterized protein n=1 Tax=Podospora australis TaxID=1536484 RepID=A0AAN7AEF8_9PEZI|nr:hypothetical protein QBC35DRAFT_467695 [Podospora australis]
MAVYEIGDAIVYSSIDGDDALAIVRSVIDPVSDTAATYMKDVIQDIESGETFTVVESSILGIEDDEEED